MASQWTQKVVRDLDWVFTSSQMLQNHDGTHHVVSDKWMALVANESTDWLASLDADPSPILDWIQDRRNNKFNVKSSVIALGVYYGYLIEYWFKFCPALEPNSVIVEKQLLSTKDSQTIGQLKFLIDSPTKTNTPPWHMECSVKFFLSTHNKSDNNNTSSFEEFVGPDLGENLAWRFMEVKRKLGMIHLPLVNEWAINNTSCTNIHSCFILKGYLFYPLGTLRSSTSSRHVIPNNNDDSITLSPSHSQGWYTTDPFTDIPEKCSHEAMYVILGKLHWLAPVLATRKSDDIVVSGHSALDMEPLVAMTLSQLLNFIKNDLENKSCSVHRFLVAELLPTSLNTYHEVSRGFILHPEWDPSPMTSTASAVRAQSVDKKNPGVKKYVPHSDLSTAAVPSASLSMSVYVEGTIPPNYQKPSSTVDYFSNKNDDNDPELLLEQVSKYLKAKKPSYKVLATAFALTPLNVISKMLEILFYRLLQSSSSCSSNNDVATTHFVIDCVPQSLRNHLDIIMFLESALDLVALNPTEKRYTAALRLLIKACKKFSIESSSNLLAKAKDCIIILKEYQNQVQSSNTKASLMQLLKELCEFFKQEVLPTTEISSRSSKKMSITITNPAKLLPRLTLDNCGYELHLVQEESSVELLVYLMEGHNIIIAMDCEWKPSFLPSPSTYAVSVVQLAISSHVFVLDLQIPEVHSATAKLFSQIISNQEITLAGFCIAGDLKRLALEFPSLEFSDKRVLELKSFFHDAEQMSLSRLYSTIFGREVQKAEQCSDWSHRPLTPSQVQYAALDAVCVLDLVLYYYSNQKCPLGVEDVRTAASTMYDTKLNIMSVSENLSDTLVKTIGISIVTSSKYVAVILDITKSISFAKLAKALGVRKKDLRLVSPAVLVSVFGYSPGCLGPIGLRSENSISVILDSELQDKKILCGAGKVDLVYTIESATLLRILKSRITLYSIS